MADPGFIRWGPFEVIADHVTGTSFGVPIDEDTGVYYVNRGYHRKAPAVKSDHRSPTWWSREVVETVAERPYVYHVHDEPNPGEVRLDAVYTRYISPRVADPAYWGFPGDWGEYVGNAEARAATNVRLKLRQSESVSLGVALAEAKKTAIMLADAGGDMAKKLINFRNYVRSLKRGRDYVNATAGAYLQGRYGWGSLARDIFDIDQRLRSQMNEPLRISASSSGQTSREYFEGGQWDGHSIWKGRVRMGVTALIADEFKRSLDGWGLLNPFEIAWEVVPYSFCVDWIIPVGNTLSSITATAGLEFESGYSSTTHSFEYKRRYVPNPWETLIDEGTLETRMKRFDRKALSGFPQPALYANENPFKSQRIADAIALIAQAVTGR